MNQNPITGRYRLPGEENSSVGGAASETIEIDRKVRFDAPVAFNGVTPPASTPTYTQTYSTADRTHANPTAVALTHAVGTADGTVADVGAAFNQGTLNDNFKECTTQIAALVADMADVKQLVNAIIDDLQARGLLA